MRNCRIEVCVFWPFCWTGELADMNYVLRENWDFSWNCRRDKLWICMEYCGGKSLQDIYTGECCRLVSQACSPPESCLSPLLSFQQRASLLKKTKSPSFVGKRCAGWIICTSAEKSTAILRSVLDVLECLLWPACSLRLDLSWYCDKENDRWSH